MIRHKLLAQASTLGLLAFAGAAQANQLYFAMPANFGSEIDTVFVYGAPGVTGTITSPNGFNSPFTVGANNVTSVTIPMADDLTVSGAITNNGFVVQTDNSANNVGASYLSRETATTDTTYLFDATGLGTSYYAVGYNDNIGAPSQLSIVATANNTTVTITPSNAFNSGQPAGTPFSVTLNAGQAVLYTSSTDVTGSQVVASAPIAVFGGSQCSDVPTGQTACDHLLTALPSTDRFTTAAIVPTTIGTEGTDSNIMRILAATNGTVVSYNGVVIATLNAGQFTELHTGAGGGEVTANNPVLVTEFLTGQNGHSGTVGDPSESWIPGESQWLSSYVFSTPVGSQAYVTNFLDLAILAADVGSLVLDGVSVPGSDCTSLAGNPLFDVCEIAIAPGAGTISDADPFLLLLDGGTDFDSYFTFAGATFSAGASPPPPPPPPVGPVGSPEPASLGLLGAGLAGLMAARRKKRN